MTDDRYPPTHRLKNEAYPTSSDIIERGNPLPSQLYLQSWCNLWDESYVSL